LLVLFLFIKNDYIIYFEEVGPENVVQVVTDNASNNMGASKLLKDKRPTIFWTSCATHTINLMLEGNMFIKYVSKMDLEYVSTLHSSMFKVA
jgi:hypothetical protein